MNIQAPSFGLRIFTRLSRIKPSSMGSQEVQCPEGKYDECGYESVNSQRCVYQGHDPFHHTYPLGHGRDVPEENAHGIARHQRPELDLLMKSQK